MGTMEDVQAPSDHHLHTKAVIPSLEQDGIFLKIFKVLPVSLAWQVVLKYKKTHSLIIMELIQSLLTQYLLSV